MPRAPKLPEAEGNAPTFFPNAAELAQATPIDVQPGSENRKMEIHVRRTRLYSVSGRVVASGGRDSQIGLMLSPKDTDGLAGIMRRLFTRPGGAFEIDSLPPGDYEIRSLRTSFNDDSEQARNLIGKVELRVADRNVENLVVELGPGSQLAGTVRIDGPDTASPDASAATRGGAARSVDFSTVTVTLRDANQTGMDSKVVKANVRGEFALPGIVPGPYLLHLNPSGLPAGTYPKSVIIGGRDVLWKPFTLPLQGTIPVEIVLAPDAAEISGVARDSDSKPRAGAWVTAWDSSSESEGRPVRVGIAGPDGAFRITNLIPGHYRVVAWEEIDPGLAGARSFCNRFTGKAVSVDVGGSEKVTADVKMIDKSTIDAETGKIW